MNIKKLVINFFILFLLVITLIMYVSASDMNSSSYIITSMVVSSGGVDSSSANYRQDSVSGTIAERIQSAIYKMFIGFWNTVTPDPIQIRIDYPEYSRYNNASLDFNVSSDIEGHICKFTLNNWTFNYSMLKVNRTLFSNTSIIVPDGSYTAKFICNDSFGINDIENVSFVVDTINPHITIYSPPNRSLSYRYITFNLLLNENTSLCKMSMNEWMTNITMSKLNITHFRYTNSSMNDGRYTARFWCNDTTDNINDTEYVSFIVDTIFPSLRIDRPLNGSFYNYNESIDFNYTIKELWKDSVWYNVNNGINTTLFGNTTMNFSEGELVLYLYANDTAGNMNRTWVTFTIDLTKPNPSLMTPINYYNTSSQNITFVWNTTDNLDDVPVCSLVVDGVVNTTDINSTNNTIINYPLINLNEGHHNWNVVCSDNANNTNSSETRNITIDLTSPIIHWIRLSDYYVRSGQEFVITVNSTDSLTDVINLTTLNIWLNGSINYELWNGTFNVPNEAGTNNLTVLVYDTVLNTNTGMVQYIIDNDPPIIYGEKISGDNVNWQDLPGSRKIVHNALGNITINWSITEQNVSYGNLSIDDKLTEYITYTGGDKTFSKILFTGTHPVVFSAIDEAGNYNSTSYRFRVNSLMNISEVLERLNQTAGLDVRNIKLYLDDGTDISNEYMYLNVSVEIKINLSVGGETVETSIDFYGLDPQWNNSFVVNSTLVNYSHMESYYFGANVSEVSIYYNMTNFIEDSLYNFAEFKFDREIESGIDVVYIVNDSYATVLSECTYPLSINDTSCFYKENLTGRTFIRTGRLGGFALVNDSLPPNLNVTYPINNSVYDRSYGINITGTVNEINAYSSMCWYHINGSTTSDIYSTLLLDGVSPAFTFENFVNDSLYNGYYNLTINCTDTKYNSVEQSYNITILDISPPLFLAVNTSPSDRTASLDIILSEPATYYFEYGTTLGLGTTTNSNTFDISPSVYLTGLAPSTRYYYNLSVCDINGNCAEYGTYYFDTTSSSTQTQQPSGDEGGSGGGDGSGGSGGGFGPPAKVKDICEELFSVSNETITLKLSPGTSVIQKLNVSNLDTCKIQINLTDSLEILDLSENSILMALGEVNELELSVSIPASYEPDIYYGKIVLTSATLEKEVDVVVYVVKRDTIIDLDVNVLTDYIEAGEYVDAQISIESKAVLNVSEIILYTAIRHSINDVISNYEEPVKLGPYDLNGSIENNIKLIRTLKVPKGTPIGKYHFYAKVVSDKETAFGSDDFIVGFVPGKEIDIESPSSYIGPLIIILLALFLIMLYLIRHKIIKYLEELFGVRLRKLYDSKVKFRPIRVKDHSEPLVPVKKIKPVERKRKPIKKTIDKSSVVKSPKPKKSDEVKYNFTERLDNIRKKMEERMNKKK